MLAKEWSKRRVELEEKLGRGIEQCRSLAADLSAATEDFKLRGFRNTERERQATLYIYSCYRNTNAFYLMPNFLTWCLFYNLEALRPKTSTSLSLVSSAS